jgi:hypothetical protein
MSRYIAQIQAWNWEGIKADAKANLYWDEHEETLEGSTFLGTITSLAPSGRLYAPWGDVADDVRESDAEFFEALEEIANTHGMYTRTGEGDGNDLFACLNVDASDVDESKGYGFVESSNRDAFLDATLDK